MPEDPRKKAIFNLRVLDEDAIQELGEKLQTLIGDATSSGRQLDELIERGEHISSGATAVKTELQQRLQLSAKALRAMEAELDRVEQAMSGLGGRHHDAEEATEKLQHQVSTFQANLRTAMDEVESRVAGALGDLDAHRTSTERARSKLEHLLESTTDLGQRFGTFQDQLAASTQKFETGLQRALEEIEAGKGEAQRASSQLDDQVYALKSRINEFSRGFEQLRDAAATGPEFREELERIALAVQGIQQRVDTALTDFSRSGQVSEQLAERLATLDRKITAAMEQMQGHGGSVGDEAVERLKPLLEELTRIAQRAETARTGLADQFGSLQDRVEAAVRGMEERLGPAMREISAGDAPTGPDVQRYLQKLEQHFSDIDAKIESMARTGGQPPAAGSSDQAHVAAALERIEERLGAFTAGAQEQSATADPVSATLETYELKTAIDRLDERLTEIVSHLSAGLPGGAPGDPTDAKLKQRFVDLQAQLNAAVERIDDRMAAAAEQFERRIGGVVGDVGGGPAPGGSQNVNVEYHFDDLREQLATIRTRLEDHVEPALLALRDQGGRSASDAAQQGTQPSGAQLDGLREQLAALTGRIERHVEPALSQLAQGGGDAGRNGQVEQRLADLRAQMEAGFGRIERRLEPALTALESQADQAAEAPVALMQRVTELQQQVSEVRHLLEGRGQPATGPVVAEPERPFRPAPVLPDTPSGKLVHGCLKAINSGNAEILRDFVADYYAQAALEARSVEDRVAVYLRIYEDSGGIELRRVEKCGTREAIVFVQQSTNTAWYRCHFELEPDAPHKIMNLYVDPTESIDDDAV